LWAIPSQGYPVISTLPLAFLAGALGGAIWGMIPGLLKATQAEMKSSTVL